MNGARSIGKLRQEIELAADRNFGRGRVVGDDGL
jgi:hypothetical protein